MERRRTSCGRSWLSKEERESACEAGRKGRVEPVASLRAAQESRCEEKSEQEGTVQARQFLRVLGHRVEEHLAAWASGRKGGRAHGSVARS